MSKEKITFLLNGLSRLSFPVFQTAKLHYIIFDISSTVSFS